jgi:hypothetical protein
MGYGAMSASNKFVALSRGSTASRTANSWYLFLSEVPHSGNMMDQIGVTGMVNCEQL